MVSSLALAQGSEDFTNSNATSSYADNSFVGNSGVTWTYVASRDANGDANNSSINLPALMLRRTASGSKITSSTLSGGIGDFSVKLYKGFTGGGNRQVELYINGTSYGTSTVFDDFTEHTFSITGINIPGNVVIELVNTTSKQVIVDDITWTGYTGSANPSIIVSNGITGLDYFEGNGPSNEDIFTVSGNNLTADITVTAPTNFEISTTSGSSFGNSITLTQSGGNIATTTIYTRLIAGLSANTYTDVVTASSTGATDKTVSLEGTVTPATPLINTSGSITDLEYIFGNGPSTDDSFNVSAMFLGGDITVTAPTNFEVSLTTGAGFANSVTISPDGAGSVSSTEIFVRLASGLAVGNYTGNVTASAAGATDATEAANGDVTPAATCSNVGDIIFTEIMQNPSSSGNDPAGEYIELYNTSASAINIQGWIIKDDVSTNESHTITASLSIPAGGYIVIGNSATTTPPLDYNYGNDISLGNSTDGIIIECSGTTIDEVIWDNGATFPDPNGASMELSITTLNATDNDTGTNWGTAITDIGNGDLGTPGGANNFNLSTNNFERVKFSIHPNPTNTGSVNISSTNTEAMNVQVFDILGKQVKNETLYNTTLNVSNLKSGVYIVKITQNNASTTKKLVIR